MKAPESGQILDIRRCLAFVLVGARLAAAVPGKAEVLPGVGHAVDLADSNLVAHAGSVNFALGTVLVRADDAADARGVVVAHFRGRNQLAFKHDNIDRHIDALTEELGGKILQHAILFDYIEEAIAEKQRPLGTILEIAGANSFTSTT